MTLERAKTILKYCGIVIAVGAILTTALGLFLAFGGGYASTNMPEAQTDPEMQKGTLAIMIGGILMAISGIIHLLQGIFSVKASNDSKFGKKAYLFGILGLVATVASAISQFTAPNQTNKLSTVVGLIGGIVVSVAMVFAAKAVKEDNTL